MSKFENAKISFDFHYQGNENETKPSTETINTEIVQNNAIEKRVEQKEQENKIIAHNENTSQEDDFFAFYDNMAAEIVAYQEEEWNEQELAEQLLDSENSFINRKE